MSTEEHRESPRMDFRQFGGAAGYKAVRCQQLRESDPELTLDQIAERLGLTNGQVSDYLGHAEKAQQRRDTRRERRKR